MTDALFGQGYFLRFDPKLWQAQRPYAPLGTLIAAAVLREAGHSVAVFDAMLATSERDWQAALDRHRPRVAVLFEDNFNYLSKMCLGRMREASLTMIRMARQAGARCVVSGSDASDHPAPYLEAGADVVIAGEGEITLREVLPALLSGRPLSETPGLVFRQEGGLLRTQPRVPVKNLDALPRPAWDLIDVARYRSVWQARHGHFSMNVATTRGCPYHCNWCAKPIYGQRYAVRSPESMADEIAALRASHRPDHLNIVDDIFGLQPGWVERFATALAERNAVTPFQCLTRVDLLDDKTVGALFRAGCRRVWVGAESGSQKILDAMEKGTRVEEIRAAARRAQAAGIEVGFFLQFGYPGETREDIEATRQLVRDCQPDDIGISVSYPLPGTRFHERVAARMGRQQNWAHSDDLAMLYEGPFGTAFYRALHGVVHAEFRVARARRARAGVRERARALVLRASLPWLRLKLERGAKLRPDALPPLPVSLSPVAAARPSEPA